MESTSKLRILCLHGFRQNDQFFREKTGGMRKLFKKHAEWDFVCAPLRANIPDSEAETGGRGDPCAWWFSRPEGNFSSRDVTTIADGFETSIEAVLEKIRSCGPFDGLLGFSQGASMVHLLLALAVQGSIQLPVRFVILCSGFLSLSSLHDEFVKLPLETPSLHIYGRNDNIVNGERSVELSKVFREPTCIIHDGGHYIPSLTPFRPQIIEFFEKFLPKTT